MSFLGLEVISNVGEKLTPQVSHSLLLFLEEVMDS